MKLITNALAARIPKLYETEYKPLSDRIVHARLYHPVMDWTWFVLEYDGKDQCFGLVVGHETELGYFSLKELEASDWYGVGVERDMYFKPTQLQDLPVYGIERIAA